MTAISLEILKFQNQLRCPKLKLLVTIDFDLNVFFLNSIEKIDSGYEIYKIGFDVCS